jgi:hypothetical protein
MIVPPFIDEPINDEIVMMFPRSVEKERSENPSSVDATSVDTFAVLTPIVETIKRFTFITGVAALSTVSALPVNVEYTTEPPYRLEINAVETSNELAVMVEMTPVFI